MRRLLVLLLAMIMIVFAASATWAAAVGLGARAVGMGGAFTAVADDGSAPYWNPAGITQIKFLTFTPAFGVEGKYDMADEFVDDSSGLPQFTDSSFNLASLSYVGITTKYVAINAFIDISGSYKVVGDSATQVGESYGYGALTVAGTFGEQLAVGVNLKMVQASVAISEITDVDMSGSTSSAEGDGMAFDIGVLYRLNSQLSLGFTGRNIFGTVDWNGTRTTYDEFGNDSENSYNLSQDLPKSYILGIAYNPYESLTLAADAEMIDAAGDDQDQTRIHIGVEQTALWNSVALRLGAYTDKVQGTGLTGGLGFKLGPVLLDLAVISGEDTGAYLTAGLKF